MAGNGFINIINVWHDGERVRFGCGLSGEGAATVVQERRERLHI